MLNSRYRFDRSEALPTMCGIPAVFSRPKQHPFRDGNLRQKIPVQTQITFAPIIALGQFKQDREEK